MTITVYMLAGLDWAMVVLVVLMGFVAIKWVAGFIT